MLSRNETIRSGFTKLYQKAHLWHRCLSKNERLARQYWEDILVVLYPLILRYGMLKSSGDEERASQFFLFLYERLPYLVSESVKKGESAFGSYLSVGIKHSWYTYISEQAQRAMPEIRQSDTSLDFGTWENLISEADICRLSFETRGENEPSTPSKAVRILLRTIHQLVPFERALIKLQFGFTLSFDEIQELCRKRFRDCRRKVFEILVKMRSSAFNEQRMREKIRRKINLLHNLLVHNPDNENLRQRIDRYQAKYWRPGKSLSYRSIEQITGYSRSALHRLHRRFRELYMENYTKETMSPS